MPYAAVDGLQMYYEEHGVPDGPPLVLLHSYTSTGATNSASASLGSSVQDGEAGTKVSSAPPMARKVG